MYPSTCLALLLPATLFTASVLGTAQIFFASDTSCDGNGYVQWAEGNGACNELDGVYSAKVQAVDSGCSVTIYTDSDCSDYATTSGLGQCWSDGSGLNSFSYDC